MSLEKAVESTVSRYRMNQSSEQGVNARKSRSSRGFTLIEVLLALAVIAIALTALLKATSQNTIFTQRLKEKSIGHWVAQQGIASIQIGLVVIALNQENTQSMVMAGKKWYWRALITPTSIKKMQKISVQVSQKEATDFSEPLIAYRYVP